MTATRVVLEVIIDEKLKEANKTAYWLAREVGIDHATLSQIRKNQNKSINCEFFARICVALDCKPGDLLRLATVSTGTKAKPQKARLLNRRREGKS